MQNKFDKEISARQLEQAKKDAVLKQQQKQQRIITISVSILLIIITVFLFFVYRSYKQKQQANIIITRHKQEVESQKHLIEEKQKEIIDSINYAKRIQSAILAKEEDIRNHFPESFLYYNPKDIVAGDFYFFEVTGTHIFYAAADCTGHGVPGALVSVVCSNALSRCVKEFGLTDPGKILDKTRELVVETFKKSGQEVKDGMDISLLVKDRTTGTFSWAGANNPLWFVYRGALTEITANKQPIGYVDSPTPFTTHALQFESESMIYLFTDGYADQFGGPRGKKFKYKQLELLLIENAGTPAGSQKEILENKFAEWKGHHEQVDDVLVIGIKI
jgi:serine phosphatase RsbU (regulator of sigma subunit)